MQKRGLTRQRRWQLARIAEGRCMLCSKARRHYAAMCDECALAQRRRNRELLGCKPWKLGGMGRPPLVAERSRNQSTRSGSSKRRSRSRQ